MKNTPFLSGYRVFKLPIVDAGGKSNWPELFDAQKIDELRQTVGPRHFSAQMMLEYISEEKIRLDPGALHFYDGEFDLRTARITNHESPITGLACYWDPSSARTGADSSVIALVLRDDKNRTAFIHDIKYLKTDDDEVHPFGAQCGAVLEFMQAHGVRHISIEVNGIGAPLPEILRNESVRRGQSITINKIVNSVRKDTRIIDSIEPLLGTGRLYAHERVRASPLIEEMENYSPAATINHDDGLDAIAGALRTPPITIRPRGTARQITAKTEFKV